MKPGEMLTTIVEFMGVDPESCDCTARAKQMDEWGVAGCRANLETIVRWWVDEARARQFVASQSPQFRNVTRALIVQLLDRSEELEGFESVIADAGAPVDDTPVETEEVTDWPDDRDDPATNPDGVNMGG